MDWAEFRSLERFNLWYDTLIDEEDVPGLRQALALKRADGSQVGEPTTLDALKGLLREPFLVADITGPGGHSYHTGGDSPVVAAWASLLVAKRLRGGLQTLRKTPEQALNWLGDFLVGALAAFRITDDGAQPPLTAEAHKTLRLLLLNEICACHKHELSAGFAEQALREIGQPKGESRNVYELVALLNQGVAYAHKQQHLEALGLFEQVIRAFDEWDENHYVGPALPYASGLLPTNQATQLKRLWERYALAPAVVHAAEVLADLNRSTEQLPLLERLEGLGSDYWKKRGSLLSALARMDGNLWAEGHAGTPELPGVNSIKRWRQAGLDGKYSLEQKRHQVLRKHDLERIRQLHRPNGDGKMPSFPLAPLRATFRSLVGFEDRSRDLGQDEERDAFLLWIDYFELLVKLEGFSKDCLRDRDLIKLARTVDLFVDSTWFPDRQQSQERLSDILEKADRPDFPQLRHAEIRFQRQIIKDKERDIPRWQRVKALRRLQVLDVRLDPSQRAFRLPLSRQAQQVTREAKDVFCDSDCPNRSHPTDETCKNPICRTNTYHRILEANDEVFRRQLVHSSIRPIETSYCLTVLRRWQSYTPALSTGFAADSRGGGYFLYRTDKRGRVEEGIVVDPGFDFVENFLREGFSVRDIDAVVMTHAHVDHTADFIPLVTLIVEYNKHRKRGPRRREQKGLLAVMSAGCFDRFERAIESSREYFTDVVVMNPGERSSPPPWFDQLSQLKWFRLEPRMALHSDTTQHDAVGVILHGRSDDGDEWRPIVAFTGDTSWWPDMSDQYRGVPTVCMNLGGIVPFGKRYDGNQMSIPLGILQQGGPPKIVQRENHLYWPGFSLLKAGLNEDTRLVVVTELGEELKGGLRTDLVRRLRECEKDGRFLPEDIGLTVRLSADPEVFCFACGKTVPPEHMRFTSYGKEESTYYICRACEEYRADSVHQAIKEYHENGWPAKVAADS